MNSLSQSRFTTTLQKSIEALTKSPKWTAWHWMAAIIPCAFIGLNSFFSTALLASQEGFQFLALQEFILRVFGYCAWAFVIRATWAVEDTFSNINGRKPLSYWLVHGGLLFAASVLFIMILSPMFFALQYPLSWQSSLFSKVFQVWLEHFGLLLLSYIIVLCLFAYLQQASKGATPKTPQQRIEVVSDGVRRLVETASINWIQAMGNYVTLHLDGTHILVRTSLNELQAQLSSDQFYRSHRSALVNISKVDSHHRKPEGAYVIGLVGGEKVPLSRQKLAEFRAKVLAV